MSRYGNNVRLDRSNAVLVLPSEPSSSSNPRFQGRGRARPVRGSMEGSTTDHGTNATRASRSAKSAGSESLRPDAEDGRTPTKGSLFGTVRIIRTRMCKPPDRYRGWRRVRFTRHKNGCAARAGANGWEQIGGGNP